ncbi:MAG TPA: hypothetical protein VK842_00545 [bacterium]|jgi:hypothetical protein|nr:hypothetical protein [bacterium]
MKSRSTTPIKSGGAASADDVRAARLRLAVQAATWWVLAQGLLGCLLNRWLADRLNLRFMDQMVPYIRQAGAGLLCLGLFLQASLRSPRYQYLAVDLLILFLLSQTYFVLNFRLSGFDVNHMEWAALVVNLVLGSALTAFRTRSSEMDPASAGTLFSLSVLEWLGRLQGKAPARRPEPEAPATAAAPVAAPAKAPLMGGIEPLPTRTKSESLPHMD